MKEDIVRVTVKAALQETNQERLRYTIESIADTKGKVNLNGRT
ncbi:MAG: hypothetical protein U5K54_07890 [Cytophagales bacterium]|nr:hypothetical protein [Cytophagales bacterium]